jgi:hypothetical protein
MMRGARGTILCIALLGFSVAYCQQPKESIRWFEMRGTEIRSIHSIITGQDYELMI